MYVFLLYIGIDVELPIVMKTDNTVAMFMTQNASMGICTRHVDTRHYFIGERNEEGKTKIKFVISCADDSNIFTKIVNQETYK
jgi:hypothetical protein